MTEDNIQDIDIRLLSINAVSKKLKLGYPKTKKLIELGIIESVEVSGKLMVPHCKLEKFITEGNSQSKSMVKKENKYIDDELKALSIISNNFNDNKKNGFNI